MREKCTGEKPHIMLTPSAYERAEPLSTTMQVELRLPDLDLNLP